MPMLGQFIITKYAKLYLIQSLLLLSLNILNGSSPGEKTLHCVSEPQNNTHKQSVVCCKQQAVLDLQGQCSISEVAGYKATCRNQYHHRTKLRRPSSSLLDLHEPIRRRAILLHFVADSMHIGRCNRTD